MRKLSETVYSSLFWLISGLLVWLIILPVALIGLPLIMLGKVAGQMLFKVPHSNLVNEENRSLIRLESEPQNAVQPIFKTFIIKTIIEVPAFLAAVMSLQPKRFLKDESVQDESVKAQIMPIEPANLPGKFR
ncbi:MAG TPA: hypothetical protein V6D26_00715 [Stenomitos sp.]